MDNEKQTVEMTAAEAEQFAAFKEAQAKKEAEAKKKADREAYAKLVDETIASSMPQLRDISQAITERKQLVMSSFKSALELKAEIFGVRDNQHSHTFTNSEGTARITLGQYQLDNYKDTVNEGIAIVKEYLGSLAKDDASGGYLLTTIPNTDQKQRTDTIVVTCTDLLEGQLELKIPVRQVSNVTDLSLTGYSVDGNWNVVSAGGFSVTLTGYKTDKDWNPTGSDKEAFTVTRKEYGSDNNWNK